MSSVLIHRENINNSFKFDKKLFFDSSKELNLDNYISNIFLPQLQSFCFDTLYIEASLSTNLLDFYGFILAYHIRLSEELMEKRYVPIVIISDYDAYTLNKIDEKQYARILFTDNIFLVNDNIENIITTTSKIKHTDEFKNSFEHSFLEKIEIKSPIDYLSHHSFTNEWSIYKWAEYFDLTVSESVNVTKRKILSLLYYKYITNKYPNKKSSEQLISNPRTITASTKILYIDDELDKGWKDIFETFFNTLFPKSGNNINLSTSKIDKNHHSQEQIIESINQEIISIDPDIVILDIRLHPDDFASNRLLHEFTGIKIFDKIKKISRGVQCIIFTASNNSLILEQLYSYDKSILGYIRKINPENKSITTEENILKLATKINDALDRVYLKDIFMLMNRVKSKLNANLFHIHVRSGPQNQKSLDVLKNETEYVFNTLNSNAENKLNYAMLSLARSLEAIKKVFIHPKDDSKFWDNTPVQNYRTFEQIILSIIKQKLNYKDDSDIKTDLESLILNRNNYIHSIPSYKQINSSQLIQWFDLLNRILEKIATPAPTVTATPAPTVTATPYQKKNAGLRIVKKAYKN